MKTSDFTATLLVDQSPAEVFTAIKNVRGWWEGTIEGDTEKLNDEFTYRYKSFHYSRQKLIEVVPGKKIVWLVTDSSINFVEDKNEWQGTKIVFDIAKKGDKTQLRFTHEGLVPECECFNDCSNGWSTYINGSLQGLIKTGKGLPGSKKNATPSTGDTVNL